VHSISQLLFRTFTDDEKALLSFMLSRSNTWVSVAISLSRVTPTRIRVVVDYNYPKMARRKGKGGVARL